MIVYFADRQLNILGSASTGLPYGLSVVSDEKSEEIETGVAIFECKIGFDEATRSMAESMAAVGNYILRSHNEEHEFYTIMESECDVKKQTMYIYAEDAGLDLLNEVVGEYEATEPKNINHYIETFAYDSGFRVGVNEAAGITKKLAFGDEETVTARLAKVAEGFGGFEISYSYAIKGLRITNKFINIHKQRGKDVGITLRLNRDIDNIITTKSIVNLATALRCTGGTPENAEDPITLRGYKYDDGDFFVDGDALKSRKALAKWSRYLYPDEPNQKEGHEGHIVKLFSYDTESQKELCEKAIEELKVLREIELNFEVEIDKLPDNVKIGDRVNIVDEAGELFLSTRILRLDSSVSNQEHNVTLGEHLIKTNGIHQKVAALAQQFAKQAQSAKRAMQLAQAAQERADAAKTQSDSALTGAQTAQQAAEAAQQAANTANESASVAQEKATQAEETANAAWSEVGSLTNMVANAEIAAGQAQQAADEAKQNASDAISDAAQAKADAADAKASLEITQTTAATAIEKAEEAKSTAETAKTQADNAKATADAAKIDAKQASDEISTLVERLETVTSTMEADYARKTDLTEAEAHLQSQISQNAGLISSTVSMLSKIDETVNDAQSQAEKAQARAQEARAQAAKAVEDAESAQATADEAAQAAQNAKANADSAQEAVDYAQSILDQAEADLAAAQADLDSVMSRADATEAEIAAAQKAVDDAQTAANVAKEDADRAVETAAEAQAQADTAQKEAASAQAAAKTAASYAKIAQSVASEAENASAAQARADEAAQTANDAQTTAVNAQQAATDAKEAADKAAEDAKKAVDDANEAADRVAQAAANLVTAKQNLADVLAKVDPTEEEIAEAQAAVDSAQAAVDEAKAHATEAAAVAAQAAIDAADAQLIADNAKTAADTAQEVADAAQQAANEAKDAADALGFRLTEAETVIKQTAEQIKLMATKEEVTETLGGYSTTEEMEAYIDTKADEINLSVSNSIDEIKIGGRNLLLDSDSEISFTRASSSYPAKIVSHSPELLGMGTSEFVVSYDGKADVDGMGVDFWFRNASKSITNLSRVANTFTTEYARYTQKVVFVGDFTCADIVSVRFRIAGGQGTVFIKNFKLERGNKPTEWTPAPEDVAGDIAAAQSTADSATERVAVAEANISMNAEQIALAATKEEVTKSLGQYYTKEQTDAAINVSSDKVTIDLTRSITNQVGTVDGKLETFKTDFGKHIKFSSDTAITIGSDKSATTLEIDNEKGVSFKENGQAFGTWNGKALLSENIVFRTTKDAPDGNFGFFPLADGSLVFSKVGG